MATEIRSLLILAPWGTDTGFRLGGAPVRTIKDEAGLNNEIASALDSGDVGVLAVPDILESAVNKQNRKRLDKAVFPVLVYYPYPEKWEPSTDADREMEEIVKRAIGYRLRIKLT